MLEFPGLLPNASRHLLGLDTSLLQCVLHAGGRLIAQLDALLPNLGTRLRSRLGCEQKHRSRAGQTADQKADQHALRALETAVVLLGVVFHLAISLTTDTGERTFRVAQGALHSAYRSCSMPPR